LARATAACACQRRSTRPGSLWTLRAGSGISRLRDRKQSGRANAISADLGTPNGAALLANQVRSVIDRLDVLVLNAGISKAARITDYTIEDFDNLFAVNVRSPFFLVQQLLPILGEDLISLLSLPL